MGRSSLACPAINRRTGGISCLLRFGSGGLFSGGGEGADLYEDAAGVGDFEAVVADAFEELGDLGAGGLEEADVEDARIGGAVDCFVELEGEDEAFAFEDSEGSFPRSWGTRKWKIVSKGLPARQCFSTSKDF